MELIMIRHLPTKWNKIGVFQGSQDIPIIPLVAEDHLKIQKNMKEIKEFNPDIILASQLQRTQQTALEYGFNSPIIEPLLNELHFGKYEGLKKKHLTNKKQWISDPRSLILGESLIDFEKRIITFIKKYNSFSRILVFGHGSWIRGLISIESIGTIQKMNQVLVENNQLNYLMINSSSVGG